MMGLMESIWPQAERTPAKPTASSSSPSPSTPPRPTGPFPNDPAEIVRQRKLAEARNANRRLELDLQAPSTRPSYKPSVSSPLQSSPSTPSLSLHSSSSLPDRSRSAANASTSSPSFFSTRTFNKSTPAMDFMPPPTTVGRGMSSTPRSRRDYATSPQPLMENAAAFVAGTNAAAIGTTTTSAEPVRSLRSGSVSSVGTHGTHGQTPSLRSPARADPREQPGYSGPAGFRSAMTTIEYIGCDTAHSMGVMLRVLAPFCDQLQERLGWERDSREDVVVIGRLETPASGASGSEATASDMMIERNRRAALVAAGLQESELLEPEMEAFKALKLYTLNKMSKRSKKSKGSKKGVAPLLSPKDVAEVVGKLEGLEISCGHLGYLPLFDLVRKQCNLPPRKNSPSALNSSPLASPFPRSGTPSSQVSSQSGTASGSGSYFNASHGSTKLPVSTPDSFRPSLPSPGSLRRSISNKGRESPVPSPPSKRPSTSGSSLGIEHSIMITPDKKALRGSRRPHTADAASRGVSDGAFGGIKPFGFGSRPRTAVSPTPPPVPAKTLPSLAKSAAINLGSDDEEFGSLGPRREGRQQMAPLSTSTMQDFGPSLAAPPRTVRKMSSAGALRHANAPPSSFRPVSVSQDFPSDLFYTPPTSSITTSTVSADATITQPRRDMTLPTGPSAFRLPMARQDSMASTMSKRSAASSSAFAASEGESDASWTGATNTTTNTPEVEAASPFEMAINARATPDLTSPSKARRQELLAAAGLAPPAPDFAGTPQPSKIAAPSPPPNMPLPALPTAPMPTMVNPMPMTGIRRPRTAGRPRTPSNASSGAGSIRGAVDDSSISKRRAMIVLDDDEGSPLSSLDSAATLSRGVLQQQQAQVAVVEDFVEDDSIGQAFSPGESPNPARPGRIKNADQMLAALTSRRSSLAVGEGEREPQPLPLPNMLPPQYLMPGPMAMALRRLSNLPEEEDEEEDDRVRRVTDAIYKRDTARTISTNESEHGHITATASPSMTDGTSSSANSLRNSGESSGPIEFSSPASGLPQTPRHTSEESPVLGGYGHKEDVLEAGRQMLLEVFGSSWDASEDVHEIHGQKGMRDHQQLQASRRPSVLMEGIKQGKVIVGRRPSRPELQGKSVERPESTLYPTWV